jgi:hypothetical protein
MSITKKNERRESYKEKLIFDIGFIVFILLIG